MIPFEIPNNWIISRLFSIGVLVRGNGIKRSDTVSIGCPCVRYGELYTTYKVSFTLTKSFTTEEIFSKSKKIHYSDVIMALTGENKIDIATAVAYLGKEEVAIGGDMTSLSNHFMNPLYLTYIINSNYGINYRRNLSSGDIIVHISNEKLGSIMMPIPPLLEQNRIVSKVAILLNHLK